MKISYNWLKEYVHVDVSAWELADILTMSGSSVASLQKRDEDWVLDVEITSNRPDCLSTIGIAREIAALTGNKLELPLFSMRDLTSTGAKLPLKLEIRDKDLCPRYSARLISGVKVSASAKWLLDKLISMDARAVNNVVDVTNFCLFESGQPMHTFDYDKIKDGVVVVRRSKKGEKIVTIDGVERTLEEGMLIIADINRPIAIAGVMGGIDTEVTHATKNVLLESAYFDPASVRKTSRKLGLLTEASYRFERGVSLEGVLTASNRATLLISELAAGTIGELADVGKKEAPIKKVPIRLSRIELVLGERVSMPSTKGILKSLGVTTELLNKDKLIGKIPSYRPDLEREIDLIEEVARIHGFGKIRSTLPQPVEQVERFGKGWLNSKFVRDILTSLGFDEIITYSLINSMLAKEAQFDLSKTIYLKNPLSAEQEIARPTLALGMLNAMQRNINRKTADLKLFEIGNIYTKYGPKKFNETMCLCIGVTGLRRNNWQEGKRPADFFDLKGVLENIFQGAGITEYKLICKDQTPFIQGQSAAILAYGDEIGMMGSVRKDILDKFDIKQAAYALEINLSLLFHHFKLHKKFAHLPKFPSAKRDISIIVNNEAASEDIRNLILQKGSHLVKDAVLFDLYAGKQKHEGKKSLSYAIEYYSSGKTLTDEEINHAHNNIKEALKEKFSAEFRES